MSLKNRFVLNNDNEIRIGNMIFTKNDLKVMFLDRRNTIELVAESLGIGRGKAYRILKWSGASTHKYSELRPTRMRVLRYIVKYIRRHKIPPTLSEIAEDLEMRVGNVHHHLTELRKSGYLSWTSKHRSIQLLKNVDDLVPRRELEALYSRERG